MNNSLYAQEDAQIMQYICSLIGHFEALQHSEEMGILLQTEAAHEMVALHTAIQALKEYLAELPAILAKEGNP